MTWVQVLVLALVQGLTEFLPISSSAHLVLASRLTDWPDQGLAFDAAVHAGTLMAVLLYFRTDLMRIARAATPGAAAADRRLLIALAVATGPALLAGATLSGVVSLYFRNPLLIAWTTIGFGLLLGLADWRGRRCRRIEDVGWRAGLLIGLAQVLALVPGTSRAGITMTAGLALGLTREAAARFSFLMAIPVIAAAGGWGFFKALRAGESLAVLQFAAAALVAALVAWATIAALLAWLRRFGMAPFVVYRLVLGVALLAWLWPGGH